MNKKCAVCGNPIRQPATGRPRRFCSHACRQLAYRRRHQPQSGRASRATVEATDLLNAVFGHASRRR